MIRQYHLEKFVHMLGYRADIQNVMSQCDFIVLSSLWEGLPLTLVEAQFATLPCLVSDMVTEECKIRNCLYLPLVNEIWVKEISNLIVKPNRYDFKDCKFNISISDKFLLNE